MNNHFFKSLKINNLRGIRSLEVDDLAQVNLFFGKNNCGKTSLLESIFLLSGMSNPGTYQRVENIRSFGSNKMPSLRNLFYNRKSESNIILSGVQGTGKRQLAIRPLFGNRDGSPPVVELEADVVLLADTKSRSNLTKIESSMPEKSLIGLRFMFTSPDENDTDRYESTITFLNPREEQQFPQIQIDERYEETLRALFFHLNNFYSTDLVEKMLQEKREKNIVRWLQYIEPKVKSLRIRLDKVVTVDIGLDSFIPINNLGSGTMRILGILTCMYENKRGILLVDEIENGLHVSSIKYMWEMVLKHAGEYNVQIFIATHSKDVLEGLLRVIENGEDDIQDSIACFWLDKFETDEVKSYRYSPEELGKALDAGIDVRY